MQLFSKSVFEQQKETAPTHRGHAGTRLRAVAALMLTLTAGMPSGFAQQATGAGAKSPDKAASDLPSAPAAALTQPLNLRPTAREGCLETPSVSTARPASASPVL